MFFADRRGGATCEASADCSRVLNFAPGKILIMETDKHPTLAILVGGGPAPGINGVIASATIEAINCGLRVLGLHDGYQWHRPGRHLARRAS